MFKQKKSEPKWHLLYDGKEIIVTNEKAMYEGIKYVVIEITADEAAQMLLAQQGKSQLRLTRPGRQPAQASLENFVQIDY